MQGLARICIRAGVACYSQEGSKETKRNQGLKNKTKKQSNHCDSCVQFGICSYPSVTFAKS